MVTGVGIPTGAHDTTLHAADAGIQVELSGQRLCRELVLREVRIEAPGVQEDRVAAHRVHHRYAPTAQQVAEVPHLADARTDMIVLNRFLDTDRHGFHVPASEP